MAEAIKLRLNPKLFDYQPERVEGKSVLITGGTTGIGRATAILFAAQGAHVTIFGRHEKELSEALADPDDIHRVFRKVDEQANEQDILINNAALGYVLTQPKRCDVVMVQIRPHLQEI